jgi:hypothetical protein
MTHQRLKHALLVQLGIIYTWYLVGGAFVFASLVKIKGNCFTQMDGTVAGHNPGYFFEMMCQSGLYWQFIGWAQLLAGLLLLTQRYALLGVLPRLLYAFLVRPAKTWYGIICLINELLAHGGSRSA